MGTAPRSDPPARPKGFFVSVGSLVSARAFLALSQILVLPILTRYVPVEEFALIALAMTVVVFCQVLSDAGLGRSLIRTKTFDIDEWSSVFWFMVSVGLALMTITIVLSFVWAGFFDSPALVPIMISLSVVPLCQSISAAPNAEIERRESYTSIAKVQMATTALSLGLAVALAVLGFGVWALVAQQITLAVSRMAGTIWLSTFRPRLTFARTLLAPHLRFAKDALSISGFMAAADQSVILMVGKMLGEFSLGIFSMSQRFARLPQFGLAGPMSTVVYVRMAQQQDDSAALIRLYLASVRLLSFAILPAMAALAIAGPTVFTVFLSKDWTAVAPVFALSIGGLALEAVTIVCLSCLFRAQGRTEINVRLAFESALLRVSLVLLGCLVSLNVAAFALALWGLIVVPRGWMLARRTVPLAFADGLKALAASATASLVILALYSGLTTLIAFGPWQEIGLMMGVWALGTGATFLLFRASLLDAIACFRS